MKNYLFFFKSRLIFTNLFAIILRDSLILKEAILLNVLPYNLLCLSKILSTVEVILSWNSSSSSAIFLWKLVNPETVSVKSEECIASKTTAIAIAKLLGIAT